MQPDLPWNVAGIPPEAREAARAAARREGLSVGEWLTRRILRSFTDNDDAAERDWRRATLEDMEAGMSAASSARDTDDMLARVSRTESDTKDIYRRIEDQLRNVARRLDATERSQSENNRAMSKAATEINVATREQAQAFEQLGSHVVKLTDRLSRVEHQTINDPIRDAVKGLHQGLSRLADQISETAQQSANHTGTLAHSIDAMAAKVAEADNVVRALEEKLQIRIGGMEEKLQVRIGALEEKLQSRSAEFDERVKPVEKTGEALDRLAARVSATEAEASGAVARLEDSVQKLQQESAATAATDTRLAGLEHALADVIGRLDATDRNALPSGKIDENLYNLGQQIEASEKRQRESVAELRNGLKETTARLDAMDGAGVQPAPLHQPAMAMAGGGMDGMQQGFDLPPFPENLPQQAMQFAQSSPGGSFDLPPPPYDLAPAPGTENMYSPPPYFTNGEFQQPHAANPATADSYIAAARRNARAAVTSPERSARAPSGHFSWGAPQPAAVAAKPANGGRKRFLLIAAIALIAFGAAVAGTLLSQKFKSPPTQNQTAQAAPQPPASMPNYNVLPPAEPSPTAGVDQSVPSTRTTARPQIKAAPPPSQANTPLQQPATPAPSPMERLSALANAGNPRAETALGVKYLDGDGISANEAEAARWLERAALQGQAVAAYRLGTLYERGHGVPADKTKAVRWYTVAANAGNRKAMHNLAVAYAEGSGAKKDMAQAANWFTKASVLGLADSQFNLAVLYERGMGVPQSLINAYKWYAVAASQGDSESKARIDALSTQLSPTDRDTAQRAAASFRPQPMDRAANAAPDMSEFAGG